MNKPIPSIEFFGCLSTVKYILNENWLKDSHSSLRLQGKSFIFNYYISNKFLTLKTLANSLLLNLYINNSDIFKYSLNL